MRGLVKAKYARQVGVIHMADSLPGRFRSVSCDDTQSAYLRHVQVANAH